MFVALYSPHRSARRRGLSKAPRRPRGGLGAIGCYAHQRAAIGARTGVGHLETEFPAKRESEPIQLDQLAFSVASADVFRRLVFAAWETLPGDIRNKFGIFPGGGYGRVSELRHQRDANIVISSGATERVAWTNATAARDWVLRQLEAQGVQLTVAAYRRTDGTKGAA